MLRKKLSISNVSAPKSAPKLVLLKYNFNLNILANYVILHTGEKEDAVAHVNIWYPYFVESGVKFIILTRFIEAYNSVVKNYPGANVAFAKDKKQVDELFFAFSSIKACFYPSNTGNNSHLLYQTHVKHIFIGHGDSDKSASAHKFFRVYDENWVAGQAHIDRILNAGFNINGLTNIKVGRPTLRKIVQNTTINWRQRFGDSLSLLYLPTWEGTYKEQDYSSLSMIEENILKLSDIGNISLSIKLHPFSGRRDKDFLLLENSLKANFNINVISKTEMLNTYIEHANLFICDISAVVSECLSTNAPIFVYIPKNKNIKLSYSNMPYEEYCYTFSSSEELVQLIKRVLGGDDYLAEKRIIAQDYILNIKNTIEGKFAKQLEIIGKE